MVKENHSVKENNVVIKYRKSLQKSNPIFEKNLCSF